MIGTENTN